VRASTFEDQDGIKLKAPVGLNMPKESKEKMPTGGASRTTRKLPWASPCIEKFDVREVTQGGPMEKNNDNKNWNDSS
jgi:hypothetical protein